MKIVISGGHLTPALALIDELKSKKNLEIIFFGRRHATEGSQKLSVEYKIINKKNIKFVELNAGRIQRRLSSHTLVALLKIPIGFIQSLFYLTINRPKLIISFGGYVSLPVVICGWLLGIKSITHEQSSVPGLATKLNSLFVDHILLTWPQTEKYFNNNKTELIGNLSLNSIYNKKAKDQKLAKFLSKKGTYIFAMGGNQGSHYINSLIFELIQKNINYNIIHQVGTTNYLGDLDHSARIKKKNYFASEYIDSNSIGAVLNSADIVISRSGANTVWDLAQLGKPAILIPLPFSSGGEQASNAQILAKNCGAIVIPQSEMSVSVLEKSIDSLNLRLNSTQKKASIYSKTMPKDGVKKLSTLVMSYT